MHDTCLGTLLVYGESKDFEAPRVSVHVYTAPLEICVACDIAEADGLSLMSNPASTMTAVVNTVIYFDVPTTDSRAEC